MRPDPPRLPHLVHVARLPVVLALGLLLVAGCGDAGATGPSRASADAPTGRSSPVPPPDAGATPTPDEQPPASDLPATSAVEPTCGAPYTPTKRSGFAVLGRFPAVAPTGKDVTSGSVGLVTERGMMTHGVTTREAQAFLVRDGRVVSMPLPQDLAGRPVELAGGAEARMPANVSLVACSGGHRLAPGRYDLYARIVVSRDGAGGPVVAVGGPWPLVVR